MNSSVVAKALMCRLWRIMMRLPWRRAECIMPPVFVYVTLGFNERGISYRMTLWCGWTSIKLHSSVRFRVKLIMGLKVKSKSCSKYTYVDTEMYECSYRFETTAHKTGTCIPPLFPHWEHMHGSRLSTEEASHWTTPSWLLLSSAVLQTDMTAEQRQQGGCVRVTWHVLSLSRQKWRSVCEHRKSKAYFSELNLQLLGAVERPERERPDGTVIKEKKDRVFWKAS